MHGVDALQKKDLVNFNCKLRITRVGLLFLVAKDIISILIRFSTIFSNFEV